MVENTQKRIDEKFGPAETEAPAEESGETTEPDAPADQPTADPEAPLAGEPVNG